MEKSVRGIGKGGAARYGKSKKVKSPKMKSPSKTKKRSPKPEISIRGIGKGGAERYSKLRKVTSVDDTIEIDPLIIEKARQEVKEENKLRRKFKIPKEYINDRLEDIPLSRLKINRKSKSPKRS